MNVLLSRESFRRWCLGGFLVAVFLMAAALFFQYVGGLSPCPLCVFQRVAVIAVGTACVAAAAHDPRAWGRAVYAGLILALSGAGLVVAGRHVWIQSLPPELLPGCGYDLGYMLRNFPLSDMLAIVFEGTGECAKINWRFLGLSMPAWVAVFFAGYIAFALVLLAVAVRTARPGRR